MTRIFLLGGRGGGGEEVFVRDLAAHPPQGVTYDLALDHHESVSSAQALTWREVAFNRIVHPPLRPLFGLRAYRIDPSVDLVHVHNAATWLQLPTGRPVVYSVGGSGYPHYLETYLGWSEERIRALYDRARSRFRRFGVRSEVATPERINAVVVFSRFAADHLARYGVPAGKIRVIPPGFRIPPGGGGGGSAGDPCTFLLVGRDPPRKGVDTAVEAIRALAARGVPVRLWLVGDQAYPSMTDGGLVQGWGPVPRDRLFSDFYRAADAVLVPSRAEGFGFAAVEAMGHGKAVIASRRDALPEILGDGGLLVEPGDPRALAEAMEALTLDPALRGSLGRAGAERFSATYELGRVQALWTRLYRDVMAGRP